VHALVREAQGDELTDAVVRDVPADRAGALGQELGDTRIGNRINLQPADSPQGPAITSAASANFAVGAPAAFTVTATGQPAPTFSFNGTLPAGLSLNSASGLISGTPATAGTVQRTLVAANGVAPDATQSFTITIAKGTQTIGFLPVGDLNVTEVDSLFASANSGLPVTFASLTPSVCSVSNTTVTVTGLGPGTCTLEAAQAGDANWNAATTTQSFFVKATQSIVFGPAPALSVGAFAVVTATATSGLPVTFESWIPEICTVSGNLVTGRAAGQCIIELLLERVDELLMGMHVTDEDEGFRHGQFLHGDDFAAHLADWAARADRGSSRAATSRSSPPNRVLHQVQYPVQPVGRQPGRQVRHQALHDKFQVAGHLLDVQVRP